VREGEEGRSRAHEISLRVRGLAGKEKHTFREDDYSLIFPWYAK
jgi:hypothetical protein